MGDQAQHRGIATAGTIRLGSYLFILLLACPGLLVGFMQPALGAQFACSNRMLTVEYHAPGPHVETCAAAAMAVEYLAGFGLVAHAPLHITLLDHPIEHAGLVSYGAYRVETSRIELTSRLALAKSSLPVQFFGQPLNGPMWQSLLAHEVAHAIIEQQARAGVMSLVAKEYLAYAALVATLPEQLREQLVEQSRVDAWQTGSEITLTYLAMGPEAFAVKSFLYLEKHPDPPGFVDWLLSHGDETILLP